MKTLRITFVFALIFGLFAVVSAQDVETETPDLSGNFVQFADGGSFAEVEDSEAFTLTLNGVAEDTAWQFITPELDGGRMNTNLIALYWDAAEDLSTSALLETEEVTLELTLSEPDFNAETGEMSFTAIIDELYYTEVGADFKEEASVPAEFGESTLFIVLNQGFIDAFNEGAEMAGVRGPNVNKNCSNPSNGRCNSAFDNYGLR